MIGPSQKEIMVVTTADAVKVPSAPTPPEMLVTAGDEVYDAASLSLKAKAVAPDPVATVKVAPKTLGISAVPAMYEELPQPPVWKGPATITVTFGA